VEYSPAHSQTGIFGFFLLTILFFIPARPILDTLFSLGAPQPFGPNITRLALGRGTEHLYELRSAVSGSLFWYAASPLTMQRMF